MTDQGKNTEKAAPKKDEAPDSGDTDRNLLPRTDPPKKAKQPRGE